MKASHVILWIVKTKTPQFVDFLSNIYSCFKNVFDQFCIAYFWGFCGSYILCRS